MTAISNVCLNMTDDYTGEMVTRTIDKTNAMTSGSECWEMRDEESQRKALESWISERGNDQHNTSLTLESWSFC